MSVLQRIANIVGWLGAALVVVAVVLRLFRPEVGGTIWDRPAWWWMAIAGLVSVLIYLAAQWRELLDTFAGRSARYGSLSLGSIAIAAGILIGLNYVAGRQFKRWDLTASKQYSLSDQTRKVLASVNDPIEIKVFERDDRLQPFRDQLEEYRLASRHVKVEYIDPDKQRALAQKYEIRSRGTILVEHRGRIERTTTNSEQEITNAIVKAVQGQQRKVYFVQGHGEHDPTSADERTGYNAVAGALGRENFTVERLVLAQQRDVPADASVVVIAGPKNDLLQPEIDALRRYLDRGGKLLLLLDPPDRPDSPALTGLIALAREWGIEVGANVVVDTSGVGQFVGTGPEIPIADSYPSHPITENFRLLTGYPFARSVSAASGGVNGRTAQNFIETSANSWAEANLKSLTGGQPVSLNEREGDKRGPIALAAAVSVNAPTPPPASAATDAAKDGSTAAAADKPKDPPQTRVAVIGDSDFVSNGFLGLQGNADLFLNTVNWLGQQESLIALRPREPDDRRVSITADQMRRIFLVTVLLLPAAVIGAGVYAWWRRRS
jgi:ABC-type uncharacterized transport system involved in gliding motility auxiliary subunit